MMFDFLSSLWGNPMAQGLLGGAQVAGPAASFGGLGGPQFSGAGTVLGGPLPDLMFAGAMPDLVNPQMAITTPADLVPQTTTPQVPQFPWATPPIMPDVTGDRERAMQQALGMAARGAGMMFSGDQGQPQMRAPAGAGITPGRQVGAMQWMPGAGMLRR